MLCDCVRDGILMLGAGVNLDVSAELHYVIGSQALLLLVFIILHLK